MTTIVEQAAQIADSLLYGPKALVRPKGRDFAKALADAGLLRDNTRPTPTREEAIEAISAALHITTDRIPGLNPGPVLTADGASVTVAADAVLALMAGQNEGMEANREENAT